MIVRPAKNKQENHEFYQQGLLGNYLNSWDSLSDLVNDPSFHEGKVCLRTLHEPGIQLPNYCTPIPFQNVAGTVKHWSHEYGVKYEDIRYFEPAPYTVTFQGEVRDTAELGLYIIGSKLNMMMRPALKHHPLYIYGLAAKFYLQKYMDPESYEHCQYLLSLPDLGAIEFSCFEHSLGAYNWNTIFWEVRSY
jgi:hypothetical protein